MTTSVSLEGGMTEDHEDKLMDLIDELGDRYADEDWFDELVEQGRVGAVLEKIALRVMAGENADVVVMTLQPWMWRTA